METKSHGKLTTVDSITSGPRIVTPEPEVSEKISRRRFSAKYKLRILQEADNCTHSGQIGALLRREGLYSSNLTTWRKQRKQGMLNGLTPKNGVGKTAQKTHWLNRSPTWKRKTVNCA